MSKHANKHWLREKEFISLKIEHDYLYDTTPRTHYWRRIQTTRLEEINRKFLYKFYNEYRGKWNTAPKHYRKSLNKIQRAKSKQVLRKVLSGKEPCFEDNYRGCNWYW